MFDADTLAQLNDQQHPPRLIYSPILLANQDDLQSDTDPQAFAINGIEPIELRKWSLFKRSDDNEAMGSETFGRVVSQDVPAPVTVGCRIFQVWDNGSYRNAWCEAFSPPLQMRKGYPLFTGRVMITQYDGGTGPLFRFEILPMLSKRRR